MTRYKKRRRSFSNSWNQRPARPKRPRVARRRVTKRATPRRLYDAFANMGSPLPVPHLIGNFVTLDTRCECEFGGTDKYFIVQYSTCACRGVLINTDNTCTWFQQNLLAEAQPTDVRAQRISVRVRNTTTDQNVAGVVRCVVFPEALNWATGFTAAGGNDITPAMRTYLSQLCTNDQRARTYTNAALRKGIQINLAPAHIAGLQAYAPYTPVNITSDAAWQTQNRTGFHEGSTEKPLHTFVMKIPGTTPSQSYSASIQCQDACLFSGNSLGAALASAPQPLSAPLPAASSDELMTDMGGPYTTVIA